MRNDILSSKQVGSQASRRVTRRLAWMHNVWQALKGLIPFTNSLQPDEQDAPNNCESSPRIKIVYQQNDK